LGWDLRRWIVVVVAGFYLFIFQDFHSKSDAKNYFFKFSLRNPSILIPLQFHPHSSHQLRDKNKQNKFSHVLSAFFHIFFSLFISSSFLPPLDRSLALWLDLLRVLYLMKYEARAEGGISFVALAAAREWRRKIDFFSSAAVFVC
jgi:hypothetical protein